MKKTVKGLALSAVAASVAIAGGYKIPEQSLNSMALGAAYVAHTTGADTNYFNPANMSFMGEKSYVEGAVTLAHLPSIEYSLIAPYSAKTQTENIVIPNVHYVSKPMGDFRWGVSLTAPGGLSKRWDNAAQKAFAEEFTLKILELNPNISYKVSDNFSIGGGVRFLYSDGVVKSSGPVSRDMNGDTFAFGYNLAMTYKPTSDINIAATYRSNVNLDEEGTAVLKSGATVVYNGKADVEIPLPAALNLAVSKTWNDKFTLEFDYERTFWSKYKALDFNYGSAIPAALVPFFDAPLPRNWKDTNTFRIGATVKMDNKLTAMMGFAIDDTPVPVETIGFELPDSDAKIFTMGFRYQQTENLSWGAAFLYDSKDPRSIPAGVNPNPILANGGSFQEGGAFLTTIGISYEY